MPVCIMPGWTLTATVSESMPSSRAWRVAVVSGTSPSTRNPPAASAMTSPTAKFPRMPDPGRAAADPRKPGDYPPLDACTAPLGRERRGQGLADLGGRGADGRSNGPGRPPTSAAAAGETAGTLDSHRASR